MSPALTENVIDSLQGDSVSIFVISNTQNVVDGQTVFELVPEFGSRITFEYDLCKKKTKLRRSSMAVYGLLQSEKALSIVVK